MLGNRCGFVLFVIIVCLFMLHFINTLLDSCAIAENNVPLLAHALQLTRLVGVVNLPPIKFRWLSVARIARENQRYENGPYLTEVSGGRGVSVVLLCVYG